MRALMQWLHLLGVVVAVGGTVFARLVLLRAFVVVDGQARQRIMGEVARYFYPMLWGAIVVIFFTGMYNLALALPGATARYNAIVGVKFVLALVLFAIAFGITIPSPVPTRMQQRRPFWMMVNLGLAAVIILLAAYLRHL